MKKLTKKQISKILPDKGESKEGFIPIQTTIGEAIEKHFVMRNRGWRVFPLLSENFLSFGAKIYGWYRKTKYDDEMSGTILIECNRSTAFSIENLLPCKGRAKGLRGFYKFCDSVLPD